MFARKQKVEISQVATKTDTSMTALYNLYVCGGGAPGDSL